MNLTKEYQSNLQLIYSALKKEKAPWLSSFLEYYKIFADNVTFEDDDLILDMFEPNYLDDTNESDNRLVEIVKDIYDLLDQNYGKAISNNMLEQTKKILKILTEPE